VQDEEPLVVPPAFVGAEDRRPQAL